jgi:hypothetical protein
MMCNLHPELAKASGGERTIAKTPKLYRLWCRIRKKVINTWEKQLHKPYDTCCKGGSALEAAANRSLHAEIAHRNGMKVVATLFDLAKFFDTVEPQPLAESIEQTSFPPIDAVLAYQIHLAPRVLQVSTVASQMIRVDLTILPGCFYAVPFVKSLMHEGSTLVHNISKHYKTYVDDVANLAMGYWGPDVQESIVLASILFKEKLVVKRKFQLSPKSAVVSNDFKLAVRVAKELAQHDIAVGVSAAGHRDVGVMFTGGGTRNLTIHKQRTSKAAKRTQRIVRVASVCRFARKLFVAGAYPQATWGHQVLGLTPTHCLKLRRQAASTTGVSQYCRRCLVSTIFVCFGRRRDPQQTVLQELVRLYAKLLPSHFQHHPNDLRIAWSDAKQKLLVDDRVQWGRVTGILSNMVATLYHIGWTPRSFSEWVQPNGVVWSVPVLPDAIFSPSLLIFAMQDTLSLLLWKQASSHQYGAGLENGIAYEYHECFELIS